MEWEVVGFLAEDIPVGRTAVLVRVLVAAKSSRQVFVAKLMLMLEVTAGECINCWRNSPNAARMALTSTGVCAMTADFRGR